MVVVILGIVLSLSYLVFLSASNISDSTQAKSQAREAGIRALDRMTMDVRQARELQIDNGAFAANEPRRCSFFADLSRDGVPDRVTYYVQGTRLYRTVALGSLVGTAYTFGSDGAPQLVLDGLSTSWTGSIFTYYNQDYPAVVATTTAAISAVGLNLVNSATIGKSTASVELSTTVKIRSVHNELDIEE